MEQVASRTTDDGTTLVLKRRKSNKFNGPYEYYVTEAGSNSRVDQLEPTKRDGMEQLREAVRAYDSASQAESGSNAPGFGGAMFGVDDGIGGGFGMGSGGPTIPGFGMSGDDEDDEDEMSQFPWF